MATTVGILGSGQVAQALAKGFLRHGSAVMMGSSQAAKRAALTTALPGVTVGSFAEAAAFGELVVLAVKGSVAVDVMQALPAAAIANKPVIDTTNPITDAPPVHGVINYFTTPQGSLGATLQAACPSAHIVKAFNSVGNQFMVAPQFDGGPPTMFICGDHQPANDVVGAWCRRFGWEVEDVGKINAAAALESLCVLWCLPGFNRNQWQHAFKLLRK